LPNRVEHPALREQRVDRQHLILDSAFLAAVVGLIFGAKPIGKKPSQSAEEARRNHRLLHHIIVVPN